jgi:hypothetical protein
MLITGPPLFTFCIAWFDRLTVLYSLWALLLSITKEEEAGKSSALLSQLIHNSLALYRQSWPRPSWGHFTPKKCVFWKDRNSTFEKLTVALVDVCLFFRGLPPYKGGCLGNSLLSLSPSKLQNPQIFCQPSFDNPKFACQTTVQKPVWVECGYDLTSIHSSRPQFHLPQLLSSYMAIGGPGWGRNLSWPISVCWGNWKDWGCWPNHSQPQFSDHPVNTFSWSAECMYWNDEINQSLKWP